MTHSIIRTQLAQGKNVVLEDLPPSGLAYALAREGFGRPLLIVTTDEERAEKVYGDLRSFGVGDVQLFPGEAHVPFDDVSPDPQTVFQQSALRQRILSGERPKVIVSTVAALQGRWMSDAVFAAHTALWAPGEIVEREEIIEQLLRAGYQRVNRVEDAGTFAVRGSIIDLYAPDRSRPVRLDLFGDELTSIKTFDSDTQRTYDTLEMLAVYPIREVVFTPQTIARAQQRLRHIAEEEIEVPSRRVRAVLDEIANQNYFYGIEALWPAFYEKTTGIAETLAGDDTLVVLDDADEVRMGFERRWARAESERERRIERHEFALGCREHLAPPASVENDLRQKPHILTYRLAVDEHSNSVDITLDDWRDLLREINARRADSAKGEILDPLVNKLGKLFDSRHEVFLACSGRGHAERLRELLVARKIDLPLLNEMPDALGEPRRTPRRAIVVAPLSSGFHDKKARLAIITDGELFGAEQRRPKARKAPKEGLSTLRGLEEGERVIHVDHGIGCYLGLKRLILNGVDGDYVHLEYAGGDKLYLPIYRLNLLQRYQGPSDAKLDKLGGMRWANAKQRVKDAVLQIAHGLLALQAKRKALPGFRLPEPGDHFRAFEATFPYEETPDQMSAINNVLDDLQKDTPMDRLICGDVGFGKTEVAVRAAYLSVLGGRQVAVLVPTTVLAEQHGQTFRERLKGEAVRVGVLSRFRSPKQTKELLSGVKNGDVDIVIGTHRLLSSDVHFKNLGLLVVDEEQRFGVKHKERIKSLRSQVHILTLSATPIPRTLNMAMVGLRDLSIIQTAPTERVSIKTEVTRFDEEVIAEAIRRELHRGGQVFVVHNRVQSIPAMADMVRRIVPEAKVVVAHGQMAGEQLERIMVDFVNREYNVLVSTAIIESGIDIPAANTMIVNRADTFGLSQLYQLRGRIGRGRERAFAHLLLPRANKITKEASERLAILKRFSDLGSGFQIASHDLDIRGAGDLLGADQSGNIAAVGFELYTELLNEAVEQAKGQGAHHDFEPDIKVPVPAVLPEAYIPQPMQRLAYYQRMSQAESDEAIFDICDEIEDLYGHPPAEVRHLSEVMVIRRRLKTLGANFLSAAPVDGEVKIGVDFLPEAPIDRGKLAIALQENPKRYRLMPSGRLAITAEAAAQTSELEFLRQVRGELGALPGAPEH